MSLLKIPFLVALGVATHVSFTSPQPTPPPEQTVGSNHIVRLSSPLKVAVWAAVVAEVVFILTTSADAPQPLSTTIQSIFRNDKPDVVIPYETLAMLPTQFLLGWLLNLVGTLIRVTCYRTLDRHFTFELSILKDHKLVTSGPYRVVRHPSYLGAYLVEIGVIMAVTDSSSWLMAATGLGQEPWLVRPVLWTLGAAIGISLVPRLYIEDNMLQKAFGEKWDKWAQEVPYWLIPGVL